MHTKTLSFVSHDILEEDTVTYVFIGEVKNS